MSLSTPILDRPPLRLVPFGLAHLTKDYIGWLNDPEVMRFSEQRHRQHTKSSSRAYVDGVAAKSDELWAIEILAADNRHIGNVSVNYDRNNGLADIGILIGATSCQGKGYGLVAWSVVLEYLKADQTLRKITGGCLVSNIAMVRIMQRSGMIADGCRPSHYLQENCPVDVVYFAHIK